MAETILNVSDLERMLQQLEASGGITDRAIAAFKSLIEQISGTANASVTLQEVNRATGISTEKLTDAVSKLSQIIPQMFSGAEQGRVLETVLSGITGKIGEIAPQVLSAAAAFTGFLPAHIDAWGKLGEAGELSGVKIAESYKTLMPLLKEVGLPDRLISGFGAMAGSLDQVRNTERGLLGMAAASGTLNDFMGQVGEGFVNLNQQSALFAERTSAVAQSTGASAAQVSEYAIALGRTIPGAMNMFIEADLQGRESMTLLQASMAVATSYGISHADVVKEMDYAYRNFGSTGDKALELVTSIGEAARALGMRMDMLKAYTEETGRAFVLFGDNTAGAINIMEAFAPALKEAGLGPQGINEVVGALTSGVAKMEVGQKAFLSAAGGGRGGLAGAFEIDRMLMAGDTAGVAKMAMTGIERQFGGGVVTTEDVGRNPELAGELEKQIQMLRSMGLATSDIMAQRQLQAMKAGAVEDIGKMAQPPEERMAEAINRGTDLQEKQITLLDQISIAAERTAMGMQVQNALTLRSLATSETRMTREAGIYAEKIFKPEAQMTPQMQAEAVIAGDIGVAKTVGGRLSDLVGWSERLIGEVREMGSPRAGAASANEYIPGEEEEAAPGVGYSRPIVPASKLAPTSLPPVPAEMGVRAPSPRGAAEGQEEIPISLMFTGPLQIEIDTGFGEKVVKTIEANNIIVAKNAREKAMIATSGAQSPLKFG